MSALIDPTAHVEEQCDIGANARIMEFARVGAGSVIGPGLTIGRYARIDSGSVVETDAPDFGYFAGAPAIQYGYACKCGRRLAFFYSLGLCPSCGRQYQHKNNIVYCTSEAE